MKFNCGPTYAEKEAMLCEWHPYFAWLPTRVAAGDCRWLETIERRRFRYSNGGFSSLPNLWDYRAKENTP